MPHRLKGLGLEVKGRLLVTVIRGNTSMVMWLYTAVKQTPSTCLHSTLHSHVCARSQTISPCSRPTSSSFQLDIQLLPWPHTMNSFQRRSPTLYYTVCVCVYECHSVIPTVGLIFFSSLKKEKGEGGSSLLSSTWPMWSAMIPLFPPSLWCPSSPAVFLFPTYASLHPLLYSLPLYFSIWSLPYLLPWLIIFSHTLYQQAT